MDEILDKLEEMNESELAAIAGSALTHLYKTLRNNEGFNYEGHIVGEINEDSVSLRIIPRDDHSTGIHYEDIYYLYGSRN